MRPSGETPKMGGLFPPVKKKGAMAIAYVRKGSQLNSGSPTAPLIDTLGKAVSQAFPNANPQRLDRWAVRCEKSCSSSDLILVATLLCGCHFRITRPDLDGTLGQLHAWLTQHPRNMDDELASLVVAALAPGLKKALEGIGHKKGWPDITYEKLKGRPPEGRGAWAASVVVEKVLLQNGAKKAVALELATELTAILLGLQQIGREDYYRYRKQIPAGSLTVMYEAIAPQYEWLLIQDGIRTGDIRPKGESQEQYAEWRQRHNGLTQMLLSFGWEPLSATILDRIPTELWQPFWMGQPSKRRHRPTGMTRV